jgi:hypothetical protein
MEWDMLVGSLYELLYVLLSSLDAAVQEEAKKREEEAEMRRRINDVLAEMQNDTRDAALEVREQNLQLRTAERSGASAMRDGAAAKKQLEIAETAFSKAEAELAEVNEIFNEIAGGICTHLYCLLSGCLKNLLEFHCQRCCEVVERAAICTGCPTQLIRSARLARCFAHLI